MCTATPQLGQLQDSYTTDGVQGPLMCDMAYPTVGPGVIYDPTGSTTKINESAGGQVIGNACIPASISGVMLWKGQSYDVMHAISGSYLCCFAASVLGWLRERETSTITLEAF